MVNSASRIRISDTSHLTGWLISDNVIQLAGNVKGIVDTQELEVATTSGTYRNVLHDVNIEAFDSLDNFSFLAHPRASSYDIVKWLE